MIECPLSRYYFCHAAIALLIALTLAPFLGANAGLAAGVAFYAGREVAQWQEGRPFDWKGLLAPFIACAAVFVVVQLVR